ncbi:MAG: NADH-quinone oxidoreductase subunit C [Spirochaetia bacterium]|nr:NADH-quinone oxidoreductase subunit C [Spirochaetia bacterium]
MTHTELLEKLQAKHRITESKEDLGVLNAAVGAGAFKSVIKTLKEELGYTQLNFVTAIDWPANNNIEVIYRLYNYDTNSDAVIRVKLDRTKPEIATISDIFSTANWHERETAEMFGITFLGHPDPNRLILPDGVIAPLRKDYKDAAMIPLPKA